MWSSGKLVSGTSSGALLGEPRFCRLRLNRPILAHCGDCHMNDGRDLKYFNYSNYSIIQRSKFHGLSELQGQQIASYIRAGLPKVPNPGEPWNPPYQPGPGLESQPVAKWAAGAGIQWVLDNDLATLPYIYPNGYLESAVDAANGWIDMIEIPVANQLPDWNHWLPQIHPIDAFGANTWTPSSMNQRYLSMRNSLTTNLTAYISPPTGTSEALGNFSAFNQDLWNFSQTDKNALYGGINGCGTNALAYQVLNVGRWQLTKQFELFQDFALEGLIPAATGMSAVTPDNRAWDGGAVFLDSAKRLCSGASANAFNGSAQLDDGYAGQIYMLAIILNSGHRQRNGNDPIDWAYNHDVQGKIHWTNPYPMVANFLEMYIRGQQEQVVPGAAPLDQNFGWNPTWGARIQALVNPEYNASGFGPFTSLLPGQALTPILQTWLAQMQMFTPAQYYAAGEADPSYVPSNNYDSSEIGDQIYNMIPLFRQYGADGPTLNSIAQWAARVWPLGDWTALEQ